MIVREREREINSVITLKRLSDVTTLEVPRKQFTAGHKR